jgi:hypothetical protein
MPDWIELPIGEGRSLINRLIDEHPECVGVMG